MQPKPTKRQVQMDMAAQAPPDRQMDLADMAIRELDATAREMETIWGVDRLPIMAGQFMAVKFEAQRQKLDLAIAQGQRDLIAKRADGMRRGWLALDKAAREAGHTPPEAAVWHGKTPGGRAFAIVRDPADATRVGQGVPIYSLDDIGALLDRAGPVLEAVKTEFPKGQIKGRVDWTKGDDIPF